MTKSLSPFLFLALTLSASPAWTQDVTLEPVADTTLFEDFFAELSNGQGPHLFAGRIANGPRRRALIRFDFSEIPDGAVLTAARLELSMTRTVSGPLDMRLHALNAGFGEGASNSGDPGGGGAPAAPGDASGGFAVVPDQMWQQAGGDFVGAASASSSVDGPGLYVWDGQGLLDDIERWRADPASNRGWILIGNEDAGDRTAKRFSSREGTGGPRLILSGTGLVNAPPPPPPAPIAVPTLNLGGLALLLGLIGLVAWRRPW